MVVMLKAMVDQVVALAIQAGNIILPHHRHIANIRVTTKPDRTLLTEADIESNELIVAGLQQITPVYPILAEESEIPDFNLRTHWQHFWLVDPLDGTRGFVHGSKEFTVNIALIEQHRPILGVIHVPALQQTYYAYRNQAGTLNAFARDSEGHVQAMQPVRHEQSCLKVLVGRYHSNWLPILKEQHPEYQIVQHNSSLKFVLLAQGKADVYPRLGPTSEWDSAAGQCILESLGGAVVDFAGHSLQYNTKASLGNPHFLAVADATQTKTLIELFQSIRRQ